MCRGDRRRPRQDTGKSVTSRKNATGTSWGCRGLVADVTEKSAQWNLGFNLPRLGNVTLLQLPKSLTFRPKILSSDSVRSVRGRKIRRKRLREKVGFKRRTEDTMREISAFGKTLSYSIMLHK